MIRKLSAEDVARSVSHETQAEQVRCADTTIKQPIVTMRAPHRKQAKACHRARGKSMYCWMFSAKAAATPGYPGISDLPNQAAAVNRSIA
jgi:hypothetical protein